MSKKEAILNAATQLFAEKGYKDTSMSDLANMTGVATSTIFYHFNNKEELFLAMLKDFKHLIVQELENHVRENNFENGLEMLASALSLYLQIAGTMENRFLILHRHDAYELARVNPECRNHLEAIYDCLIDFFESAIIQGQKDGSIREMSSKKGALILFGMVDGLARFNTYELYDAGGLYDDILNACTRMLCNEK